MEPYLSPQTAPAFISTMTLYLFRMYRIMGEAEAAGVKPLLSVQVFLISHMNNFFRSFPLGVSGKREIKGFPVFHSDLGNRKILDGKTC